MAEKIVKPKKFTAEWFRYIWDYYKTHILVSVFVVIAATVVIADIANTVESDVTVNYIATNVFPLECAEQLESTAGACIEDINNDGKQHVTFSQLNFTDEVLQDGSQVMTYENKRLISFASEEEMLYIFDEFMLKSSIDMPAAEGIFVPVQQWLDEENAGATLYEYKGETCAVSLSESRVLKELGLDCSDMYIVVRMNYSPENITLKERYENCVVLANMLLEK